MTTPLSLITPDGTVSVTSKSDTTRALAEKLLDRLGAQDQDGIQELFAPAIDWHVPGAGTLPWTGRRSRREEVAPYFTTMWAAYVHRKSEVVTERLIVEDEHVVILGTFSHLVF
ncbi:nuclear transport factor 2 family protein [Streptomyces sp. NBC_01471]|uniref:nuclear transport factor 2 family protein n=1 Tax=Streptomyces sp. NBC_01471 TaxID=2903879 RepID=UPI002F918066